MILSEEGLDRICDELEDALFRYFEPVDPDELESMMNLIVDELVRRWKRENLMPRLFGS